MRVKICCPGFSFTLHYSDLVKYPSLESCHSHLHWLSLHRHLYILLIRLSTTQPKWTCCWLKASIFAPVAGRWWLLTPAVPVSRWWCSCGGDKNNLSTGVDNASSPSMASPVEMTLETVQVCLYSLWNHCHRMDCSTCHREEVRGCASWDDGQEEPVRLWLCVHAKGILLLRYAVQVVYCRLCSLFVFCSSLLMYHFILGH